MSIHLKNMSTIGLGILIIMSVMSIFGHTVKAENTYDLDGHEIYLPDIYENTVIYNGTTMPHVNLTLYHEGDYDGIATSVDEQQPFINQAGQFSFAIYVHDELQAGDIVTFMFSGPQLSSSKEIELVVQEEKEGMEIIEQKESSTELEEAIQNETSIEYSDLDHEAVSFEVTTVGDVDQLYGRRQGETLHQEYNRLEHNAGDIFQLFFTDVEPGETFEFYILASGITTKIEKQVEGEEENLDEPETEQNEETENDQEATSNDNDNNEEEINETEMSTGSANEVAIADDQNQSSPSMTTMVIISLIGVGLIIGVIFLIRKIRSTKSS
ncbi:hypothetical protein BTS2_0372 [Bacillus sp. TS-2]|nr:hypothetical protein BTS2_0372 [Bacillus sp. TS-2]